MSFKKAVTNYLYDIKNNLSEIMIMLAIEKQDREKEKLLRPEAPFAIPNFVTESTLRNEIAQKNKKLQEYADLVSCESCGCLLKKDTARKGDSEIRVRKLSESNRESEEYIYHPYYCNKCGDEKTIETTCDYIFNNSSDEQLKRAQKDFFLGQAELLRQQAEAQRIKNRIDEKTWFPKKEGK
jgi:hypothetical protein